MHKVSVLMLALKPIVTAFEMKVSLEDSSMSANEICFLCLAAFRLVYHRRSSPRVTISWRNGTSVETSVAVGLICDGKVTHKEISS